MHMKKREEKGETVEIGDKRGHPENSSGEKEKHINEALCGRTFIFFGDICSNQVENLARTCRTHRSPRTKETAWCRKMVPEGGKTKTSPSMERASSIIMIAAMYQKVCRCRASYTYRLVVLRTWHCFDLYKSQVNYCNLEIFPPKSNKKKKPKTNGMPPQNRRSICVSRLKRRGLCRWCLLALPCRDACANPPSWH